MGTRCSSEKDVSDKETRRERKKSTSNEAAKKYAVQPAKPSWSVVPSGPRMVVRPQSRDPSDYLASGMSGVLWSKLPGEVSDQRINIDTCKGCTFVVLDQLDSVQVDDCENCLFIFGPTMGSIFLRNCKNCRVMCLCGQLRTRDVSHTTFSIYCQSRPVIESSSHLRFASYASTHSYFQLLHQMCRAKLSPFTNLWSSVHDFTSKAGNYTIIPQSEVECEAFCPKLSALVPQLVEEDEEGLLFQTDAALPVIASSPIAEGFVVIFAPGAVDDARSLMVGNELERRQSKGKGVMASVEFTFGTEVPPNFSKMVSLLGHPSISLAVPGHAIIMMVVGSRPLNTENCLLCQQVGSNAEEVELVFADLAVAGRGFGASH